MAMTIGSVIFYLFAAGAAWVVYQLYVLTWKRPREFIAFMNKQGVKGAPFKFLVGDMARIQKAAAEGRTVEVRFCRFACFTLMCV